MNEGKQVDRQPEAEATLFKIINLLAELGIEDRNRIIDSVRIFYRRA